MREEFEKWAKSTGYYEHVWGDMERGWIARQPEIDALTAKLESMIKIKDKLAIKCNEQDTEIDALKAEVKHWKANHENMVNRSRVLIDRPDLPLERVQAFRQIERIKSENERLRNALGRLFAITDKGNADTHEQNCMCVYHEAVAAMKDFSTNEPTS